MSDKLGGFLNPLPKFTMPDITLPDKRSRTEIREDFEKELELLDREALSELKNKVFEAQNTDELWRYKEEIENALIKQIRYINKFEDFNSEGHRKVELKEEELKLDAKHDWRTKWRILFFRVLASVLFVITLFTIGYVENRYDWAKLPMVKYIKPAPEVPTQKLNLK